MSAQRIFLDPLRTVPANIVQVPVGAKLHNGLKVCYPYYFVAVDGTDCKKLTELGWKLDNAVGIPPVGCHMIPAEWLTVIISSSRGLHNYVGVGDKELVGTAASHRAQEYEDTTTEFGGEPETRTSYSEMQAEIDQAVGHLETTLKKFAAEDIELVRSNVKKLIKHLFTSY